MNSFVIGNGTSRLEVDLHLLKSKGKIYGCNALYREFIPDYLIAVDARMIDEIVQSGYNKKHQVWTNQHPRYKTYVDINFITPSRGWSSGPSALLLASTHSPSAIFILGFDYTGINNVVNNVYSDTKNYKKSNEPATYYKNWLKQTEQIIKSNPTIQYYRVVGDTYFDPHWKIDNFRHMKYNEFKELHRI